MDVRLYVVGMVQANCYLVRRKGSTRAVLVDPGDEASRLLALMRTLGVSCEGILVTHAHFDHVAAVAPIARATGAEVWVSELERKVLADLMSYARRVPTSLLGAWPGFGPFESYEAERTLIGGERLELAGLELDVLATPGHTPGSLTFSMPEAEAIFSGDLLYQGSVGRTDLPGGDRSAMLRSIRMLGDTLPGKTTVYPGHMGVTTLGAELAGNPFLADLRED